MKKVRTVILILVGLGILGGLVFFLVGYFNRGNAGILVESTPGSNVYIAGEQVGRTPYEANLSPGEIVVKLIPDAADRALAPFETKVTLSPGIKTIIRREFGETEETSAGEIVSFEKVGDKEVSISVVSVPNSAQITIDGAVRGFAPYKTTSISPGEHSLVVSSQGYIDRTITVKAASGYRLTAVVKIKPSERFPFLEEDTQDNWFKIEYEEGKEGWVTGQYTKKVEVEVGASGTPTPSQTKAASHSATITPTKKPTPTLTPKPTATP